jgi:hypothetical protein
MDISHKYVEFDEVEDVLTSVELVALLAPKVGDKPSFWKWIIIGAHSALQGAMVCALADSTGTSVLTKTSAEEVLRFFYADAGERGDYPEERLARFAELLERCQQRSPTYEPLVLTADQCRDIKRLHRVFRNKFAHFTPDSWFIEKVGLPRITGVALDVTEELMNRYRWPVINLHKVKRGRLTAALSAARGALRG